MSQYTLSQAPAHSAPSATPNSQATPGQVSNAISTSLGYTPNAVSTNPHDAPGYNPATDKTSSAYNPNATDTSTATTPKVGDTIPGTNLRYEAGDIANLQQPTSDAGVASGIPGQSNLTGDTASQAGQAVDQLKAKYGKALTDITGTGVQAPSGQGSANAGINAAIQTQPQPKTTPTPDPTIASFLNPDSNDSVANQIQAMKDIVSPEADREQLNTAMSRLNVDQANVAGLQSELMNVKNIMAGTQQDIADEVTKAGGTISASLLANMTVARNKALLAQGTQLQEQLSQAQNIVQTDTTLVGDAKTQASTDFTQNMGLLNFIKTTTDNQTNAAKDSLKAMQSSEGWDGIYKAALASGDPTAIQKINDTMGPGFDISKVAQADAEKRAIDATKTASELASEQANIQTQNEKNGVPIPSKANSPGFDAKGVKYTTTSAANEVNNELKNSNILGTRNLIPPPQYNQYKAWWIEQGLSSSEFDGVFGGQRDSSKTKEYN